MGLYISPVGFSSNVIPEQWRLFYSLNPMVAAIDGFRWSITGNAAYIYLPGFFLSSLVAVGIFLFGLWSFKKMECEFADII
jgi:lipopolysaccharide transport system permease protein